MKNSFDILQKDAINIVRHFYQCDNIKRMAIEILVPEIILNSRTFTNDCLHSANEACWYGNNYHAICSVKSIYAESRNNNNFQ